MSYSTITTYPTSIIFGNDNLLHFGWTASDGVTFRLRLYVGSQGYANTESQKYHVGTRNGITSHSYTYTISAAEQYVIISQRRLGSGSLWIELTSYDSNGNSLGSNLKRFDIVVPARNSTANEPYYEFGGTYTIPIIRNSDVWRTYILVYYGSEYIRTYNYADILANNWNINFTVDNTILPSGVKEREIKFDIWTTYPERDIPDGEFLIRETPFSKTFTVGRNAPPIWSTSTIPNVTDINSSSISMTGNSSYIVQNKSNARLNMPVGMVTGATGSTVTNIAIYNDNVFLGNVTPSTTVYSLGTIPTSGIKTITLTATDNYDNSSSKEVLIDVIPYANPIIISENIERLNGYQGTLIGGATGNFSRLVVNGVRKNTIASVNVYYKEFEQSSSAYIYVSSTSFTVDNNNGTWKLNAISITGLDENKTYSVLINVTDSFGAVGSYEKTVGPGTPLVYFDKVNKSVGFGKFPTNIQSIETPFTIRANNFAPNSGGTSTFSGAFTVTGQLHSNYGLSTNYEVIANTYVNAGSYLKTGTGYVYFSTDSSKILRYDTTNSRFELSHELFKSGGYKFYNADNMPIQTGRVGLTSADSSIVNTTITFPTQFTEVPRVFIQVDTSLPGTRVVEASIGNTTATSFQIYLYRTGTATNTGINWFAIGKMG